MKMKKQSWNAREHFGAFLRAQRKKIDASVYDLGYVLNVSSGTIWHWEVGKSFPADIVMLRRLALTYDGVYDELKRIFQLSDVKPYDHQWKKFLLALSTGHTLTLKDKLLERGSSKDKRYDRYKRAFGDYLRAGRLERGLTGASIARGLGTTGSAYFQWEAGVNFPQDITTVAMLDKMYGDTLDVIFGLCPKNGIHLTLAEENGVSARLHDVGHFTCYQSGKPKPPGFNAKNHKRLVREWQEKNRAATTPRALSILDKHGPLTLRGFARRTWPNSKTWQKKVARIGSFGPISGPAQMNTVAGAFLGRLRVKGLVKKVDDKYNISAKGRKHKTKEKVG